MPVEPTTAAAAQALSSPPLLSGGTLLERIEQMPVIDADEDDIFPTGSLSTADINPVLHTSTSGETLPIFQKDTSAESLLPHGASGANVIEGGSDIPEVAATVPTTDDPNLPTLTFRYWLLSTIFTFLAAAIAQFYFFRANTMTLSSFFIMLVTYAIGKLLARILPTKVFKTRFFSFTLNPGPFNIKEHMLICVTAGTSAYTAYAIDNITVQRLFYNHDIGWVGDVLLLLTTQCIGYGMAGFLRNILVKPARMLWPSVLVSVALFHALHNTNPMDRSKTPTASTPTSPDSEEKLSGENIHLPKNVKGGMKTSWTIPRMQLFTIILVSIATWQIFPGYIAPILSSMALLCWMNPSSMVLKVLGSGYSGLGLGVISLDWNVIGMTGPMYTPWWAQVNFYFGAVLMLWIVTPITYFTNLWDSKLFPPVSAGLYTTNGSTYDLKRVLTPQQTLNDTAYYEYSQLRMSTYFAISYGISFLALTATITHVLLWYGYDLYKLFRGGSEALKSDIHARMMERYKEVPMWWYFGVFVACLGGAIFTCEFYDLDLPWWALIVAIAIAVVTIVPIGIIQAITLVQISP